MAAFAAIVLTGGRGRRLGGVAKPSLDVGGRSMLTRVLSALAAARPRIVVGVGGLSVATGGPPGPNETSADPTTDQAAGTIYTVEEPPGGGPVAAIATGLALLGHETRIVGLFAADLPFLVAAAVGQLASTATAQRGAMFIDDAGRAQWLCSAWPVDALRQQVRAVGELSGAPLRVLLEELPVTEVVAADVPPPWYDCDTEEELAQARRWAEEAGV